MAGMSMGDYGKDAPTGGGIRLRILRDAIVERKKIEVVSGGKALITTSDSVLGDMNAVISGSLPFDSPNKTDNNNFVGKYKGKKVLVEIKKQGRRNVASEITLTKIKKTVEFGSNKGSGGGADATALFEGAACWVTAYRYSLNRDIDDEYSITLNDLKKVSDHVSTDKSVEEIHAFIDNDPVWMKSSIRTANKLYSSQKYKNQDFVFYRGTEIANFVAKHFAIVNREDGRPFSNINKWSPADIYMSDDSFLLSRISDEMTFQGGFNKVLLELITEKKLIGVSLKKVEASSARLTEHNFTRASANVRKPFESVGSKTLMNSMDVYLYGQGYNIQFRATDREGKTWQGEMIGKVAKHGKIGGGVLNYILESIYGAGNGIWREYPSAAAVSTASRNKSLDQKIYDLATKNEQYICAEGEEIDLQTISEARSQWKFSKYIGLTLTDILMSGSDNDRDELTTKIYLYATSASDDSAPYIKIS